MAIIYEAGASIDGASTLMAILIRGIADVYAFDAKMISA